MRILQWLAIGLATAAGLYALFIGALLWFGNYMNEGELLSQDRQTNVLVALSNDPPVIQALLSGCLSVNSLSPDTQSQIAAGRLAEVPSGTRMHLEAWVDGNGAGRMSISEGRLKDHLVWACRGHFVLIHPMP